MSKDNIYERANRKLLPFRFDKDVAEVFEDMIQRSVPGYAYTLDMIRILAQEFYQEGTRCYDLGCSLGASTRAIVSGIKDNKAPVIAVDNSAEMLEKCKQLHTNEMNNISWVYDDIQNIDVNNASIIVINFTLQFIPTQDREKLIAKLYDGLVTGGILILSEKIKFENQAINDIQTQIHHAFKKDRGYSDLEIAGKRSALENVLIPETEKTHVDRLKNSGFKTVTTWFQCFNFASFIAHKPVDG